MRRHPIGFALCAGWLLLFAPPSGHAQKPPAVAVEVDPCVPVDHGKLHELLAIELGTSTAQGSQPAAATRVGVSCSEPGIELRVEDRVTGKSMTRVLPASSFADASSTRLLALAIAEFVVASWIELRLQPAPAVQPVGPRAGPAARRVAESAVAERTPASSPILRRTLSAGASAQFWSAHDAVLFGGGVRVLLPLWAKLVWTASADLAIGRADADYGRLGLFTTSVALAVALQLQLDPRSTLELGPGGRLGVASIDGDADPALAEGDDFIAPFGGPLLLARVVLRAGNMLRVGIDVEGGWTTLPVRAQVEDEGTALELDGGWVTTMFAVGLAF